MTFIGTKSFVEAYSARLTFCFLSATPGLVRIPLGVVVRATPTFHVSKIFKEEREESARQVVAWRTSPDSEKKLYKPHHQP